MIGTARTFFCGLLLAAPMLLVMGLCGTADALAANDLQGKIRNAEPGETIVLEPGIYEGPIVIDRAVKIRAALQGETVLRNTSEESALTVAAGQAEISGLRIEDTALKEAPSVLVTGSDVRLEGLNIRTGADGVVIRDADGVSVSSTVIEWAPDGVRTADKGNGIDLYNAHNARLTGNVIRNMHDGIYIENSDDTLVKGNKIESSRYGIHCMYTKGTLILENQGHRNVTGAMVMAAQHAEVSGNTFAKQSENVHSQGILFFDAHESKVTDNRIEGNRVGLYVELSSNNFFAHNNILYNYIGLQLLEAENNTFTENVFAGNVADAAAKESPSNDLSGNYWDSFRGLDPGGDGRSDISYAIHPLFLGLADKKPAFQLFFQSPGMVFLEGLYQADRNSWAADLSPLMELPASRKQEADTSQSWQTGLAGLLLAAGASFIIIWARRNET